MATDAPIQVPMLKSYTQPFTGVDSVAILATDHGLGPVTLQTLIVQVYEVPAEEGYPSQLMLPAAYEYVIDATTHDVLVGLRQPTTGSVLLTVLGPPVPLDLPTMPTMPPVEPSVSLGPPPTEEPPPAPEEAPA
ncbi:MAG TPA: hypothetical protein VF077_12675 [Nitrospiraceae bacterium]